jgi:hypothetical protein
MTKMDCHAWPNGETWAAAVGLVAERHSLRHIQELAQKAKAAAFARGCAPQWLLADWLRDWVERGAPEFTRNLYNELLQAALARVDWYDVAAHMLDGGEDVLPHGQTEESDRDALSLGPLSQIECRGRSPRPPVSARSQPQ